MPLSAVPVPCCAFNAASTMRQKACLETQLSKANTVRTVYQRGKSGSSHLKWDSNVTFNYSGLRTALAFFISLCSNNEPRPHCSFSTARLHCSLLASSILYPALLLAFFFLSESMLERHHSKECSLKADTKKLCESIDFSFGIGVVHNNQPITNIYEKYINGV